jgi:transcription elongation factor GreA
MTKYLTKEGLEKLKKELTDLETRGRKEAAEKMRHAISFGDLSENAAYDDARESQNLLEAKIAELKDIIGSTEVIDMVQNRNGKKEVQMGSLVLLLSEGKKMEFQIVGQQEADVLAGKISYQSPLGKLLLGKIKGDKVCLVTPGGKTPYEILEIK